MFSANLINIIKFPYDYIYEANCVKGFQKYCIEGLK